MHVFTICDVYEHTSGLPVFRDVRTHTINKGLDEGGRGRQARGRGSQAGRLGGSQARGRGVRTDTINKAVRALDNTVA